MTPDDFWDVDVDQPFDVGEDEAQPTLDPQGPSDSFDYGRLPDGEEIAVKIGPCEEAGSFWQKQLTDSSCGLVAQMTVASAILHMELDEGSVTGMAIAAGIFDPEFGTSPADMGKLLELLGIPVETRFDASIADIAEALERGESVLVGLDALEIWGPQYADGVPLELMAEQDGQFGDMGHAVWVTGLERAVDGDWYVVLNDSGHPEGRAAHVRMADFLNAWDDMGRHAITTCTRSSEVVA